jgi:hypothetical protein
MGCIKKRREYTTLSTQCYDVWPKNVGFCGYETKGRHLFVVVLRVLHGRRADLLQVVDAANATGALTNAQFLFAFALKMLRIASGAFLAEHPMQQVHQVTSVDYFALHHALASRPCLALCFALSLTVDFEELAGDWLQPVVNNEIPRMANPEATILFCLSFILIVLFLNTWLKSVTRVLELNKVPQLVKIAALCLVRPFKKPIFTVPNTWFLCPLVQRSRYMEPWCWA